VLLCHRAVVVLSASFDPGWTASIDGRPAPTVMMAPAEVGVWVPPGRHTIEFRYVGFGNESLLLSLSAIVVTFLLVMFGVSAARRIRPARRAA
jgi:uncharacterized membrane protein YfhO